MFWVSIQGRWCQKAEVWPMFRLLMYSRLSKDPDRRFLVGRPEIVQDLERINGILDSQSQTYQMCKYKVHSKNRGARSWPGPCALSKWRLHHLVRLPSWWNNEVQSNQHWRKLESFQSIARTLIIVPWVTCNFGGRGSIGFKYKAKVSYIQSDPSQSSKTAQNRQVGWRSRIT